MREVYNLLWIGNQDDGERERLNASALTPFDLLLAAKEPWHRACLNYTGRACDKTHPEYLMARRGNILILNLVDAPKAEFFDKRIINAALDFIDERRNAGRDVLVCCNKAESRSPSIALLYLIKHGIIKGNTLEDCEAEFMKVYPEYNPGAGIRGFMKEHWSEYCG